MKKITHRRLQQILALAASSVPAAALAQSYTITSSSSTGAGSISEAINAANAWGGGSAFTINFTSGLNVTLGAELPILNNSRGAIINGNGATINGNGTYRGFFLGVGAGEAAVSPGLSATTSTAWRINNLTIQNAVAQGGRGGGGGGGGAGLGGAIFVNAGQLTLDNVNLSNNTARGGDAPIATPGWGFGGGGGMGGDARMGGGGFGRFVEGPVDSGGYYGISDGNAGNFAGGAAGGGAQNAGVNSGLLGPRVGGSNGGGGANLEDGFTAFGGGGGVGGGITIRDNNGTLGVSGNGGFGGGGGSSGLGGGHGGYGGGGGGGLAGAFGGNGGFGGGAGASFNPGAAGFGGGTGVGGASTSQGGGGAGLGGGIFVRQGASVEIINGGISGGTVAGGTGFTNGQGIGSGLFLAGSATFNISGTTTINDSIGGGVDSLITGGLTKTGSGFLILNGDNSFVGGTTISQGTLLIGNANGLGPDVAANPLRVENARFANNTSIAWSRPVTVAAPGGTIETLAFANLSNVTLSGSLAKLGTSTLQLTATGNQVIGVFAGDLRAGATNGLGTGEIRLANNTTLSATTGAISIPNTITPDHNVQNVFIKAPLAGTQFTLGGPISGSGTQVTVAADPSSVVAFGGNNTYDGGTVVTGGTLSVGSEANLGRTWGILTLDGGTLRVTGTGFASTARYVWLGQNGGGIDVADAGHTFTISQDLGGGNPVPGGNGLTKFGAGTLRLTGANAYTGATTVNGGTLAVDRNASAAGSPVLTAGSGPITVNAGATLRFDTSDNFGNHSTTAGPDIIVHSGTVASSGDYVNALQNLTLNNSTLSAAGGFGNYGSFSVRNTLTSTGDSSINIGGTGALALSHAGTTLFDVQSGTLMVNAKVTNNVSANAGRLVKSGLGTMVLTGANTFSGDVHIERGVLAVNSDAALGATGVPVSFDNGELRTDAPMTIARNLLVPAPGSGIYAGLNTNGHDVTVTGELKGNGAGFFIKSGNGTLTLTNNANSQGTNRFDAGTVVISDDRQLGAAGETLYILNAALRTDASITTSRGLFLLGGVNSAGTFDTNGNTLGWQGSIIGVGDLVKAGAGTLVLYGTNSFAGAVQINDFGTLAIRADSGLGDHANVVRFSDGTLRTDAAMTLNRSLQIQSGKVGIVNTNGNDVTLSGVVSGNGGFIKQGAGTLTLGNISNSQSNNRIDAGTLAIGDDRHLGASGGTLFTTGGTLRTDASINTNRPMSLQGGAGSITTIDTAGNTLAWNGIISGTGNLTKSGNGTLVMSRANTFAGDVTVQGGTLALSNDALGGGRTLVSPTVTVGTGATLRFDLSNNFGSHNATTGPNIVVNGGTVTNSGGHINALQNLTLNDGTLSAVGEAGNFGAFSVRHTLTSTGNSTIHLAANRLTLGQDGDTTFDVTGGTLTVTSPIADNVDGPGTLIKSGGGTLVLGGINTYTGGTTVDGGTLALNRNAFDTGSPALASNAGTLTVNTGATLRFDTSNNLGNNDAAAGPDIVVNNGTVTNSGGYNNALQNLTLNDGTLNAVGAGGGFGAFSVRNTLASTGHSTIDLGTNRLTLGQDGDTTFDVTDGTLTVTSPIADNVDGPGALVKTGTGTLALRGNNTHTGPTTVSAGTLVASSLPNSALSIGTGATLAPGGSIGTLTLGQDLTLAAGSVLQIEFDAGSDPLVAGIDYDTIVSSAALDLRGVDATNPVQLAFTGSGQFDTTAALTLATFDGGIQLPTGLGLDQILRLTGDTGGLTGIERVGNSLVAVVPEPATLGWLAVAGTGLLRRRRR